MRRRKELDLYELPNGVKVRRLATKPTDVRENSNGSERKPLPANELSSSHPPAEDPSPRLCPHQKSSSMDSHFQDPSSHVDLRRGSPSKIGDDTLGGEQDFGCRMPISLQTGSVVLTL